MCFFLSKSFSIMTASSPIAWTQAKCSPISLLMANFAPWTLTRANDGNALWHLMSGCYPYVPPTPTNTTYSHLPGVHLCSRRNANDTIFPTAVGRGWYDVTCYRSLCTNCCTGCPVGQGGVTGIAISANLTGNSQVRHPPA